MQKKDYLMKIIPEDFKIDQKKIEKLVEKRIESKLKQFKTDTTNDLINDTLKLYFQILDKNSIYGYAFTFYSRNINLLMDIKKLADYVINFLVQRKDIVDKKSYNNRIKEVDERRHIFDAFNSQIKESFREDEEENDNYEGDEMRNTNFSFQHN